MRSRKTGSSSTQFITFTLLGCTTFCLEHMLEWNLESERELRTEEEDEGKSRNEIYKSIDL